jgi:Uma2 family endonuclease
MATAAMIKQYTPEEYLALERKANFKSEYKNGFITAMAGTSPDHNTIALNLASEIRARFRGKPCEVYMSGVRLRVCPTGLYTYHDVMAVRGGAQFMEGDLETLLNPTMIAEVLSKSTEAYDRGDKFVDYRTMPSLPEYVLVAQDRVLVERFTKQGDEWLHSEFRNLDDMLVLESIGCAVPLREIYAGVELSRQDRGSNRNRG